MSEFFNDMRGIVEICGFIGNDNQAKMWLTNKLQYDF